MGWAHHDSKEPFWASADSSSGRRDPVFGITKSDFGTGILHCLSLHTICCTDPLGDNNPSEDSILIYEESRSL